MEVAPRALLGTAVALQAAREQLAHWRPHCVHNNSSRKARADSKVGGLSVSRASQMQQVYNGTSLRA